MATKNQHPEKKEKEGETEEINPDELADYESDEDDRAPAAGTKQTEKKNWRRYLYCPTQFRI